MKSAATNTENKFHKGNIYRNVCTVSTECQELDYESRRQYY